MAKLIHTPAPETEEQLVALLATLRVEPVEEADFESRFLSEFHDRVAREAVCCPARRHLFSHLVQLVHNFGRGRLAFGASAMGLGLVAVCFALYPAEQTGIETTTATAVERHAAPLLLPALSDDLADCTTVRVRPNGTILEIGGVTVIRGQDSTVIEVPNTQIVNPQRQGNFISLPATSVRYAF